MQVTPSEKDILLDHLVKIEGNMIPHNSHCKKHPTYCFPYTAACSDHDLALESPVHKENQKFMTIKLELDTELKMIHLRADSVFDLGVWLELDYDYESEEPHVRGRPLPFDIRITRILPKFDVETGKPLIFLAFRSTVDRSFWLDIEIPIPK